MAADDYPTRAAMLLAKSQEPHIQAIVAKWPDPSPEALAFMARILSPAMRRVVEQQAADHRAAEENAA
ncbi:hypothetical protein ACIBCT_20685 [Streptosporangium sp. NPDC050855]|uniref:hypothetical protein n=1 Tax=Streptosporangium sp. NPDC050855 TaxID=3366194 RepID=UPI0037B96124